MGLYYSTLDEPIPPPPGSTTDPSIQNYLQQYYVSKQDMAKLKLPDLNDYISKTTFSQYQKTIEDTLNGIKSSQYTKDQIDEKYQQFGKQIYEQLSQVQSSPTALQYRNPYLGATRITPTLALSNSITCIGGKDKNELVLLYGPSSTLDTIMPLNGGQIREMIRTQPDLILPYTYAIREMIGSTPKLERVKQVTFLATGDSTIQYELVDPSAREYGEIVDTLTQKYYGYLLQACRN